MGGPKARGKAEAGWEDRLREAVGDGAEIVPPREGRPLAARPSGPEAVSRILAWASREGCPVAVAGLGSYRPWEWGGGRLLLEMDGLAGIEGLDERSLMVRAGAGARLVDLVSALASKGYDLGPIALPAWARTLGGALATAPASRRSTALAALPSRVVGAEFVTADGAGVLTKAVPRSAAGPDVKTLLTGSWGTLGIFSRATLAIRSVPPSRKVLVVWFASIENAAGALRDALLCGASPSFVRLASSHSRSLLFPPFLKGRAGEGAMLALGFEGADAVTKAHQGVARQASTSGREGEDDAGRWEEWREMVEAGTGGKAALAGEASSGFGAAAALIADVEKLGRGGNEARAGLVEASPQIAIVRFSLAWQSREKDGTDEKTWKGFAAKLRQVVGGIEGASLDWLRVEPPGGPWWGLAPDGKLAPWVSEIRGLLDPAGILNPGRL